jgi:hypothetical protein
MGFSPPVLAGRGLVCPSLCARLRLPQPSRASLCQGPVEATGKAARRRIGDRQWVRIRQRPHEAGLPGSAPGNGLSGNCSLKRGSRRRLTLNGAGRLLDARFASVPYARSLFKPRRLRPSICGAASRRLPGVVKLPGCHAIGLVERCGTRSAAPSARRPSAPDRLAGSPWGRRSPAGRTRRQGASLPCPAGDSRRGRDCPWR